MLLAARTLPGQRDPAASLIVKWVIPPLNLGPGKPIAFPEPLDPAEGRTTTVNPVVNAPAADPT